MFWLFGPLFKNNPGERRSELGIAQLANISELLHNIRNMSDRDTLSTFKRIRFSVLTGLVRSLDDASFWQRATADDIGLDRRLTRGRTTMVRRG
jgi:hypothetical protein